MFSLWAQDARYDSRPNRRSGRAEGDGMPGLNRHDPVQSFADTLIEFDRKMRGHDQLARSLVPVNGQMRTGIRIRGADSRPLEEYYKWQFLYALIHSGLFPKDYIGAEVWFPKGNKGANALQVDAAIFDHADWIERYQAYWRDRKSEDLHWLGEHLLAVVEFKRDERQIEQVFTQQIKPAMREKEPSDANVLGMFYDKGRLLLFHRRNGRYLRYDEALNQKGDDSQVGDLSLQYQTHIYSSLRSRTSRSL